MIFLGQSYYFCSGDPLKVRLPICENLLQLKLLKSQQLYFELQ